MPRSAPRVAPRAACHAASRAARPACRASILLALLAACAAPPPKGLTPPAATDAAIEESAGRLSATMPPDRRLVGLRIALEGEPENLLDERGAGVLVLRPEGERKPAGLVFVDGAMTAHALPTGTHRIETIAGYDCGPLWLSVPPRAEPLALGTLTLVAGAESAGLSGGPPTPGDLALLGSLVGAGPDAIEAAPLERRERVACTRRPLAVARPDIDPTAHVYTPAEIAGGIALVAILGAATGGAIASGSIVFTSGAGGGALFLSL